MMQRGSLPYSRNEDKGQGRRDSVLRSSFHPPQSQEVLGYNQEVLGLLAIVCDGGVQREKIRH